MPRAVVDHRGVVLCLSTSLGVDLAELFHFACSGSQVGKLMRSETRLMVRALHARVVDLSADSSAADAYGHSAN